MDLGGKFISERFAENPFLLQFYEEAEKYAFQLELSLLADRYQQMKSELSNMDMFNPLVISDYYFAKSLIFARVTLKNDEFSLYRQLFDIIHQQLPIPDIYIYLHLPVEKLLENIRKRGRSFERNISPDYLKDLEDGYFNYLENKHDMPILILDTSSLNFVDNSFDFKRIRDLIMNQDFKSGITRVEF